MPSKGDERMQCASRCFLWGMAIVWLMLSVAHAGEVVLTTGERFSSDKIWEEKDKIRFNMQGLVVSVDKADVASIVRDDGAAPRPGDRNPAPHPPSKMQPQPAPAAHSTTQPPRTAPASSDRHVSTPAPSAHLPHEKSGKEYGNHQKVSGIGFDGLTWRMRPSDLPGLSKIKTEAIYGGVDQYWQPDGPLSLGDALLDGLVFGFWQNRLYTITMWVDGKPGYERLKRSIFKRYGRGEKGKKSDQDRYVWVKDKTTDRLLEFDAKRNIGIFWMRSRDLDAHIKSLYPLSASG
jgi:hypothetical protein